jgi:hypothetical protein
LSPDFDDSREAAFRRELRARIRRGPFTKTERDVVLAFVNHWLQMRRASNGVVYPGRKKIAKKADASIRTVATVFRILRNARAIVPVAHLNGLEGKATEYVVNVDALRDLCSLKSVPEACRIARVPVYGAQNCTGPGRAKIAHRSYDGDSLKPSPDDNVIRLAFGGGCDV